MSFVLVAVRYPAFVADVRSDPQVDLPDVLIEAAVNAKQNIRHVDLGLGPQGPFDLFSSS